jgi:hypothetical protein
VLSRRIGAPDQIRAISPHKNISMSASAETVADVASAAEAAIAPGAHTAGAYKLPLRHVFNQVDLERWLSSPVGEDFFRFIGAVNAAISGQSSNCACAVNEVSRRAALPFRDRDA